MTAIHFGMGSFKKELWIQQKAVFMKPKSVDVEFVTSGSFEWLIADEAGSIVKTLSHANGHGGWTSIHLASLGLFGDYSIGFKSTSPGEKIIKQGDVYFKCPSIHPEVLMGNLF